MMFEMISSEWLPSNVSKKCMKFRKSLGDKSVDISATGQRDNNELLKLLKCESKENKICLELEVAYTVCHGNVMGTGSYNGKKHCGEELAKLLQCVLSHKE
jgi:hypothetical protein